MDWLKEAGVVASSRDGGSRGQEHRRKWDEDLVFRNRANKGTACLASNGTVVDMESLVPQPWRFAELCHSPLAESAGP